jgi:hypothetical protein
VLAEFCAARFFPAAVRGPVDFVAFRRLASARRGLLTVARGMDRRIFQAHGDGHEAPPWEMTCPTAGSTPGGVTLIFT